MILKRMTGKGAISIGLAPLPDKVGNRSVTPFDAGRRRAAAAASLAKPVFNAALDRRWSRRRAPRSAPRNPLRPDNYAPPILDFRSGQPRANAATTGANRLARDIPKTNIGDSP